jgi:hypothetical protein
LFCPLRLFEIARMLVRFNHIACCVVNANRNNTIWIADAHRDNGKRFVVRADDKLTAFLELERVTR